MNIKLFSVDFDSLSEILNLSNNLRSRVGELRTLPGPNYAISRRERHRQILQACQTIWNSDISFIYEGRGFSNESNFYVYAHLDTTKKRELRTLVPFVETSTLSLGITYLSPLEAA